MADRRRLLRRLLAVSALASVTALPAAAATVVHSVGSITRHAAKFIGQDVTMHGYMIGRGDGYILFSDEPGGRIGRYDLPVSGIGVEQIVPGKRFVIEGKFLDHGLAASNGNPDHLELSTAPQLQGH